MKTKIVIVVIMLVLFFFLLPEPEQIISAEQQEKPTDYSSLSENFIIQNVRIYDGETLFEKADIHIEKFRVKSIGKEIPITKNISHYDGSGKTLLPGFIDSHTHAYGNALKDALNFGVTTELDMFTMPEFANSFQSMREQTSNNQHSDLFSSTILATTEGGHGTEYGFKIPVLADASQAEHFVKERIAQGADYIKAVYNSKKAMRQPFPSISLGVLSALAHFAHQQNKKLLVHVDNLISAKEAIESGVDGLVHSFMDTVVDENFVRLMKDKKVFIIPTLSVQGSITQQPMASQLLKNPEVTRYLSKPQIRQLKSRFPDFGIPSSALQKAYSSVKKLSEAGITILAGTDAPNPGTTHGASLHGELQLLVKAGLSNQQVIHSATGAASTVLPIGSRGTLKIGALASMILVDGDPFRNIKKTSKIVQIWKNGQLVERDLATSDQKTLRITPSMVTDFNQSIAETMFGRGIAASTDQLAGGKSVVTLKHSSRGKNDRYVHIEGEIKNGFMFPWSGLSFLPGESMQQGVDFSELGSITFDAKTTTDSQIISVLIFQQGSFQPFEQKVELNKFWKNYRVELASFAPLDLENVVNVSIVVNNKQGPFEFDLDNLKLE